MTVYLLNIALILFFGVFFFTTKYGVTGKKLFYIIVSIQWILISGLRHVSIGSDTSNYKNMFLDVRGLSWDKLWIDFVGILFKGVEGKDPGYAILVKLFHYISTDYQIYLIAIAIFVTVSLSVWLYKNSRNPVVSYVLYSCLFYSFFAITGIRQSIAMAMVVFIGYELIKKKKLLLFFINVLVASTIHLSALVFFPFYWLANIKITKLYLVSVSTLIILSFILKNQIKDIIVKHVYQDYSVSYAGAGTWTFTFLLILVALASIYYRKTILKNNPQAKHYFNALIFAFLFLPLTFINPSAMRIVMYFSVFLMLLIPEILKSLNKGFEQTIAFMSIITILIVLFVSNAKDYLFFWQG